MPCHVTNGPTRAVFLLINPNIMDIKSVVAKLVSDCDLRKRFLKQVPDVFNDYFVTNSGELVTEDELKIINSLRYFSNGLDMVSGCLAKL